MINLPGDVKYIIEKLEEAGFEGYAVGGCVRDSLLGREPKDWDVTTNATPVEVKNLFRRTVDTGIEHGTVTVMLGSVGYEVTTYRIDGKYEDSRHPKSVTFTPNLKEDLLRRDFTINAMAYSDSTGLVDMYDGQKDLSDGIIRCVGDAKQRFSEDALRMMRAVRFSAQLGFDIETETYSAIKELAPNLEKISAERIYAEMVKTLTSKNPMHFVRYYETGMSKYFLPEFDDIMECNQNNPHHCYSVGEHTLHVINEVSDDAIMRLAALFHDIAKPQCKTTDAEGIDHFKTHPEIGARMASSILKRLKSDNNTIDMVKRLVKWHDVRPIESITSVRKVVAKVGAEYFEALMELQKADILGQSDFCRDEKLYRIEYSRRFYNQIIEEEQCLKLADMAVKGSDLISIGVEKGPRMGVILNDCLEQVIEEPSRNSREYLMKYIRESIANGRF